MAIQRVSRLFGLAAFACAMTAPLPTARAASPTIGLFTDYGWDDAYVAQLKGSIITIEPNARILDLVHTVDPYSRRGRRLSSRSGRGGIPHRHHLCRRG